MSKFCFHNISWFDWVAVNLLFFEHIESFVWIFILIYFFFIELCQVTASPCYRRVYKWCFFGLLGHHIIELLVFKTDRGLKNLSFSFMKWEKLLEGFNECIFGVYACMFCWKIYHNNKLPKHIEMACLNQMPHSVLCLLSFSVTKGKVTFMKRSFGMT